MNSRSASSTDSVRVIRVFLASPSDLAEERRAARGAVNEINRTVARPAGFHVDLIGWEDTLSSAGRPQEIINEDLQTCQMFIGMLWSRWGTAPDLAGNFSSGFDEEFHLASERNSSDGEPHITLLFKDVETSKLADPGPELSKVLRFKQKIINEKKVLFDSFNNPSLLAEKICLSIAEFIHKLDRPNKIERTEVSSSQPLIEVPALSAADSIARRIDNLEGDVLSTIGKQITRQGSHEISSVEVARLRNIALTLARSDNDQTTLDAHDANLIYRDGGSFELSPREISGLADAGLEALGNENVPVWSWIGSRLAEFPLWLTYSTFIGPDRRRIGALRAMTILMAGVVENEKFKKSEISNLWFDPTIPSAVRNAALEYLGEVGTIDMIIFAEEEFSRNDYSTVTKSLEAILDIQNRENVKKSAEFAINVSFGEIKKSTLDPVLQGFKQLDNEQLLKALDHRSGPVRAKAIETLSERRSLNEEQIRRFFGDTSLDVRKATIAACKAEKIHLSLEDLKEALILKEISGGLLVSSPKYDFEGNTLFQAESRSRLSLLSISTLEEALLTKLFDHDNYYFAFAEGHFNFFGSRLRYDFDDRFERYWIDYLDRIRLIYPVEQGRESIISLFSDQRSFRIRRMMRDTLDILVKRGFAGDLPRIRKALDDDVVDPRPEDINFLRRWGAWEDIGRLIKIAVDPRIGGGLGLLSFDARHLKDAASGILKLSGDRLLDILSADMPDDLLAKFLSIIPASKFRKISRPLLLSLLSKKSDSLRKATVLQILASFSRKDALSCLHDYLEIKGTRFYNVIFWLDLAKEFDKSYYKSICLKQLRNL